MFSTYSLHLSKNFPAGPTVQDVLRVLHNPQQEIRLSPIVHSVTPDPEGGEDEFIVVERVPLIGCIYVPTTYKLTWKSTPDGCEWQVEANFGTRLSSRRKVRDENGVVVFTEDLTTRVSARKYPDLSDLLQ